MRSLRFEVVVVQTAVNKCTSSSLISFLRIGTNRLDTNLPTKRVAVCTQLCPSDM